MKRDHERQPLLEVEIKEWEMTDIIKKLKQEKPEQFVRSKQYIVFMKQFEALLKAKLAQKLQRQRPAISKELDMEILICMYNLFVTLCE